MRPRARHRLSRRNRIELNGVEELARLYALRILDKDLRNGHLPSEDVLHFLLSDRRARRPVELGAGVSPRGEPEEREGEVEWDKLVRRLRRRLQALARRELPRDGPMAEIVQSLSDLVGLDEIEREVFFFVVLFGTTRFSMFIERELTTEREISELIADALAIPYEEVRRALAPDGTLRGGGLVIVGGDDAVNPFEVLSPAEIVSSACNSGVAPARVLEHIAPRAPSATLSLSDFEHVGAPLALLRRRLEHLQREGGGKLQVLVHGPPGVGKTELVRALAAELGGQLHEVRFESGAGQPLASEERLLAYRLVQRLLCRTPSTYLVFEEIEDLFPVRRGLFGPVLGSPDLKALTNRALEDARVPTFFVSNEVNHLDPAISRRFDFVLSLGVPPRSVRRRMWDRHLAGLPVSEAWLSRIAERADLAPASIERAVGFVRGLAFESVAENERALEQLLDQQIEGGKRRAPSRLEQRVFPYELARTHTDVSLDALLEGLAREGRGTLLFSGPPGTGKTEAAHELARKLERPIVVRSASSLLDKYLGATEQNIARAFSEARDEGAILLLDEIDSFLRPREGAVRSWEVTQVNELLVQIEQFDGILIATTNFLEGLDRASLRRFAVKVRFLPASAEQRWQLLTASLEALAVAPPGPEEERRLRASLERLPALTPGHFATTVRNARLVRDIDSAAAFVARLAAEHAHEPDARRRAGFA